MVAMVMLLTAAPALATTVQLVPFEELVRQAEVIFVGEVVQVQPFRVASGSGAQIRTRVTFRVRDNIRGAAASVVLEFKGGTIGDVSMAVEGAPTFAVGEEYIVLARTGTQWVSPVVGLSQGLLRVSRDARDGTRRVLTAAREPVSSASAVGRAAVRVAREPIVPMTADAFVAAIRAEIARQAAR
jgi:hypothetical protein